MSLFYVTDKEEIARNVAKDYKNLFGNASATCVGEKLFFVSTKGYSKREMIRRQFNTGEVFVVGTIFDANGFNQKWLDSFDSIQSLRDQLLAELQCVYGHYVVIIISENNNYEVIPDRLGLLNVYYSQNEWHSVSNDLVEIGRYQKNVQLHEQSVYEFLMSETNVNQDTILKDVQRLCLGNRLVGMEGGLKEEKCYWYKIIPLTKAEYFKRVEQYFQKISTFEGSVGVDMSAGFDTRTVLASCFKKVKIERLFTNRRKADEEIDYEISAEIAKQLEIPLEVFDEDHVVTSQKDEELIAHCTTTLRNCFRSNMWIQLFQSRYAGCELSLGGYGGEAIRGHYNIYTHRSDVKQSIQTYAEEYYHGTVAERLFPGSGYTKNAVEKLENYEIPQAVTKCGRDCNWLYVVDKMRIWGSAMIQTSMIFGDTLHPFMDWELLGALFGLGEETEHSEDLQKELIHYFCPNIDSYPINRHMNAKSGSKSFLENILTKGRDFVKERMEKRIDPRVILELNDSLQETEFGKALMKMGKLNSDTFQRLQSIMFVYDLMKDCN